VILANQNSNEPPTCLRSLPGVYRRGRLLARGHGRSPGVPVRHAIAYGEV
jgi:hypothetical protein